jgi:putative endonuclease
MKKGCGRVTIALVPGHNSIRDRFLNKMRLTPSVPSPKQKTGIRGEDLAAAYLENHGFRILERNYRFRRAEIDLICLQSHKGRRNRPELVFVEVKSRNTASFGYPEDAVDRNKQRNLIKAARAYLFAKGLTATSCRFDVVSVENVNGYAEIMHIENAFTTG